MFNINYHVSDSATIFGSEINVHVNEASHRELNDLTESRISLETLILRNQIVKTGFLMWISSHCILLFINKIQK